MSNQATNKSGSILRERWRHNRKLLETVRNAREEPYPSATQDRAGELLKDFSKPDAKKEPTLSEK